MWLDTGIDNSIQTPFPRKGWVRWYSEVTFNLSSSVVLQFLWQVLKLYYLHFLHVEDVTTPRSCPKKAVEGNNSLNCLTSERKQSWALWTLGPTIVLTHGPPPLDRVQVLAFKPSINFYPVNCKVCFQGKEKFRGLHKVAAQYYKASRKPPVETMLGKVHSWSLPLATCRLWSTQPNWSLHL